MGKKKTGRQDLLPGTLDMLVLKSLSIGVMHGYGIAQHIRSVSGEVLHVEEGSLYPALQRMLKAGWLSAEWGVSPRNRQVRVYKLTRDGRKQLERKVSAFERLLEGIIKVLKPAQ
jgi:PadR family transcriptional regulator PadR